MIVCVTVITKSLENWKQVVTYMYDDKSSKKSELHKWKIQIIKKKSVKFTTEI